MKIYILTYKREDVRTLKYIPLEWMDKTYLVVQENDHTLDHEYIGVQRFVLPSHITNVATTRQYVMDHGADDDGKLLQLDDDLTIGVLKEKGSYALKDACSIMDMPEVLTRIQSLLEFYPHIGACARNETHLNYEVPIRECSRAIRFHGLNVPALKALANPPRFDRVPTIEDYDFILQLLRNGVNNAIDCQVFVGDGGSNADGGCSEARAAVKDGHYAELLKSYHPEFVKLVQKVTKRASGDWVRTDVRVQWKKALEWGKGNLI